MLGDYGKIFAKENLKFVILWPCILAVFFVVGKLLEQFEFTPLVLCKFFCIYVWFVGGVVIAYKVAAPILGRILLPILTVILGVIVFLLQAVQTMIDETAQLILGEGKQEDSDNGKQ